MKKISSILMIAVMAIISLSFTSCDKDSDIAYTLDGTWKGDMYIWYGNYESSYSIIEFDQNDGWYSGTGYWTDFYDGNYWGTNNYRPSRKFSWTVRNSNIYINFYDGSSSITIYNYTITDNYFRGTMDAANGNRVTFNLSKYGSSYNWNDYYYNETNTSIGSVTSSTDSIKPRVYVK